MKTLTPGLIADIVAILTLLAGSLLGLVRGLSGEIAGFVSTVASFLVSLFFLGTTTTWLKEHGRLDADATLTLAFFGTFVGLWLLLLLPRLVLRKIMKVAFEPAGVERGGGLLAGFVKAAILIFVIYATMLLYPHDYLNQVFGEQSYLGRGVGRCLPFLEKKVDTGKLHDELEDAAKSQTDNPG